MLDLKGKTAIVTGGTKGIGYGITEVLADLGADVVVTGIESDVERGKECEKLFADKGQKVKFIKADGAKYDEVENMIKEALKELGKIDILVNNAGITRDSLLMRMKESDWDTVINVNLKSVFNTSKAVLRHMMKAKSGRIINISSVVGVKGQPGQTNYAASKAGIIGFTMSLAKEVGSRNITVNAVAPGFIKTEMTEKLPEDVKQDYFKRILLSRFGEVKDVAYMVGFLASDLAGYLTGHTFSVDGGLLKY